MRGKPQGANGSLKLGAGKPWAMRAVCLHPGDGAQERRSFEYRKPRVLPAFIKVDLAWGCNCDRAQPLAAMALAHGHQAPGYQELCTLTKQYDAFCALHNYVQGAARGTGHAD